MHEFRYKNNKLYCESVNVSGLAKKFGTPLYIYSHKTLISHFNKIKKAFEDVDPLICFAMKANDNMAIVKSLVDVGSGCDIVSGGELKKALKVKSDPKKIVFASVGKTDDEISSAIKAGILFLNAESLPEIERINLIAKKLKKKQQVALRINPDVEAPTHEKIVTGTLSKKFGIDLRTAYKILKSRDKYPYIKINGLHIHIGSQITSTKPYIDAIKKVIKFLDSLKDKSIDIEYFDIGGGFGIDYKYSEAETADAFAKKLVPYLKKIGLKIIIEPGRFICGSAGIFVTKVLFVKDNGVKKFLIVDGGMNDLVRPSLYNAYHDIIPLTKTKAKKIKVDVVGPICESGDFFAKGRILPKMARGDYMAIMQAGAYCYVMASNYNVRPRAAELMIKGNQFQIVKKREAFKDLVKGEKIPKFLGES